MLQAVYWSARGAEYFCNCHWIHINRTDRSALKALWVWPSTSQEVNHFPLNFWNSPNLDRPFPKWTRSSSSSWCCWSAWSERWAPSRLEDPQRPQGETLRVYNALICQQACAEISPAVHGKWATCIIHVYDKIGNFPNWLNFLKMRLTDISQNRQENRAWSWFVLCVSVWSFSILKLAGTWIKLTKIRVSALVFDLMIINH